MTLNSPRAGLVGSATVLLLACLALGPDPGLAATPADSVGVVATPVATPGIPTLAELEARTKEAESATGLDEATKTALIEAYRRTAPLLESARDFTTQAEEYSRALAAAPAQAAEIRKRLAGPDQPRTTDAALAKLTNEELNQQLVQTRAEAAATETRIAELDRTLERSTARPAEVRTGLTEVRQALEQLEADARPAAALSQATELTQANAWLLAARRQALTAEARALEQELASQAVRDELARAQREQLGLDLRSLKDRQSQLQGLADQRRKTEAEQAQRETEAAQRDAADKHPLIQQVANDNAELTDSLSNLTGRLDQFTDQLAQLDRERKRVETDFRGARERIDVAGVNQALGQILIDRRHELPDLRQFRKEIARRHDQIADATLSQIRYREEQRTLRDLDLALAELAAGDPAAQIDPVRAELRQLLEKRRELVEKALAGTNEYIRKQAELNDATDRLIQTATDYDAYLAEHLLWVRSAGSVSLDTLRALPGAVGLMLSITGWTEVGQVLTFEFRHSPLTGLGLAAVLLLLWKQAALKRAILATADPLRRVRTDRFSYTLKAIALTWLAALPLPLAFLLLGREMADSIEATTFTRAAGHAISQTALGLYFLRAFRITCIPGGVADRHFRWETEVLTQIRHDLRWFTPYIICTSLVAYGIAFSTESSHLESLGRLAVIAVMLGTAVFLGRLLHPRSGVLAQVLAAHPTGWANRLRTFWYSILIGAPLALGVLALLGYLYTAGTLFESLVETAWSALGLVLLQQLIVRWLVYTRRQLALQAALDRQAARRAQAETGEEQPRDAEGGPPVEEPEADLASLDEQTRKLLSAVIFFLAVLALWLIWAPMLPALTIFEKLTLWHTTKDLGGVAQQVPVTAANVGLVLVILVAAMVAARNLPALIEILLLQSSGVTAGTRYAVRTLVSYAITAVAVLAAFGSLGLQWSQVQWLVAGMSVGIGFGLQEIVANFISGLIILFERPVRVGDVVTIGTTTGTVTKIEIRATTIRNWDRQELIVPNKEFITGRLLNWTLSDQINRIVVNVGIEYDSDPKLALTLLTETAAADPRILKDPPPLASLDGFGDNSLTLVLRCFLDSMDGRVAVTTDLNLAIERAFRAHGIGIAYPQRDLHISAREPINVRLQRAGPPNRTNGVG